MTFYEKMIDMLKQHGMFESHAKEALEPLVNNPEFAASTMIGRWNDSIDEYPPVILNVLWIDVRDGVLKWIEENLPEAFYKPMFYPKDKRDQWLRENNGEHLIK